MENTCRLCLNESQEIVEELCEGCDILDKLSVALSYTIPLRSNLPNKVCQSCKIKIEDIYTFYQTINQNENILQQKFNTCNSINSELKLENVYYDENETGFTKLLHKEVEKNIFKKNTAIGKESKSVLNESNYIPKEEITNDTKQYKCLTCFSTFPAQFILLKHYQIVELAKFNEKNKIKNNELVKYKVENSENGSLIYKCEKCFKKYNQKSYIERHILTHIERRPFLCKLCGKTYPSASAIVAHGKMHTGLIYTCSYKCGYKSVHKHVVKDHEKRHAKEFKYKCEICSKGFQVKTCYEQHYNIHNGVKPFICNICGKTFHLQKYLKTHKSNVHPQSSDRKPWICKLCSLPCDSKNALNLHMKEKHDIVIKKSILCDICGVVVRDAQQLKEHKWSRHSIIRPYVCGICNKSFPKKSTLKVHEQTHRGKQYLCDTCNKMFSRKSTLERHILSICNKSFPKKSTLKVHEQTHRGKQYLCDTCNKMFSRKSTLERHILRFHNELKQNCTKCQKITFLSKEKFRSHKKSCLKRKQLNETIESQDNIINK